MEYKQQLECHTFEIVSFLNAVQENNNRAWFAAHKMEYQKAQKRFNEFVDYFFVQLGNMSFDVINCL